MRVFLILCWLMVPVLAWAYHLGPGQELAKLDDSSTLLSQANLASASGEHAQARDLLTNALASLPAEHESDARVIRLELAKAQMQAGQLPEARVALEQLLDELESSEQGSHKLEAGTREALANSQYYMTWLMRLEGLPAEEWEPEAEAARQNYRLLAEEAQQAGDTELLEIRQQDLEATIRLARMELDELQALKLPKQCNGCCSGQCKKPGNKQTKKKGQKKGSGSNMGPLPDGSGA